MGLRDLALLLLAINVCHGLYTSRDDVIELTDSNFDSKVLKSDGVFIVEFYSPQCGHCVNFAPAYKSAAKALKGVISVGAVDASSHGTLANKYNVRGFPTVLIFGADKKSPQEFQDQRTEQALVKAGLQAAKKLIDKRLGVSSGDSSSDDSSSSGVIELTESNFEKMVLNSHDTWFIGFFAPWCGHCQRLKPDFESTAKQLRGKVKVGSVDATVHTNLASRYNVRGYPTLYLFGADKRNPSLYDGGRTSKDMYDFLIVKAIESLPPPKAEQLIKPEQLEVCKEKQLCIIAALPDLLDCQSKCRKDYIKAIEKAGEKHKANDWKYFWFPATVQPDLEKALNLGGFGYPAMVAMNQKKSKYAILKGSFSESGINEFLRDVSLGSRSISLQDISSMPKVVKTDPWDGKDGKMVDVDEISLDDLKDEL